MDEAEASNEAMNDARRLINALRSAAQNFHNSKFRQDMNRMMMESPLEFLEKVETKYRFVLPKDMTMERARAVLTKQNIVRLGANPLSSPGTP